MEKLPINRIEQGKRICHQIGIGLQEVLFPPQRLCPVCQQEQSERRGLGLQCIKRIALVEPPLCGRCGRPKRLDALTNENLCSQCVETAYFFSRARAVGVYEGALREYLTELKYRYRPDLGEALGALLVEWVKVHPEYRRFDLIVPIPVHPEKLAVRGYNQAELLAGPLGKHLGIPVYADIIRRDRPTESQNALDRQNRFSNVKDAFRVSDTRPCGGANVLIVDDILTTGATASEAARMLLRSGAREVKVLTLAVGIIESEWTVKNAIRRE